MNHCTIRSAYVNIHWYLIKQIKIYSPQAWKGKFYDTWLIVNWFQVNITIVFGYNDQNLPVYQKKTAYYQICGNGIFPSESLMSGRYVTGLIR